MQMPGHEDEPLVHARGKGADVSEKAPARSKLLIASVGPWLTFVFLLTLFGFRLHDSSPVATWIIGACFFVLNIFAIISAYWKASQRYRAVGWNVISAVAFLTATLCGIGVGDWLYWTYARQYYQFQKTSPYVNVDPSKEKGQSKMDAGQVYFKEGTFVATEEAIAYQMNDVYCAAPIVRQPVADQNMQTGEKAVLKPYSGTIDFWAIGVNCCMPSGERFRCFDTQNPHARSGMRLLRDDLRPFFKLAVEEWSAKYSMPVKHPLFFYWVYDPLSEVEIGEFEARWRYWFFFVTYLFCNIGLVQFLLWMTKRMDI